MEQYLGDFKCPVDVFANLAEHLEGLRTKEFAQCNAWQKKERVNFLLCQLIQEAKTPCFLLPAVLQYITQINALKILEGYAFYQFELWLNQFSSLNAEENAYVRAKIAGKFVPREEYQRYFPIGMGKQYAGSHYVTAHGSPDLDTTIASFWGWLDAFAARVSDGLHVWNVPGGPPASQIEIELLFYQIFGGDVFESLAKTRTTLALSALDLMKQRGLSRKERMTSTLSMDHEQERTAVVLVDEEGYYEGDWTSIDVEGVRNVILLLAQCLRWFENHLQTQLISLLAKTDLASKDLPVFSNAIFQISIGQCEPAKEFTAKQRLLLAQFLHAVFGISLGLKSSFGEFAQALRLCGLHELDDFVHSLESVHFAALFDASGKLVEGRPQVFHQLEKIILHLRSAMQTIRTHLERLDVALLIKDKVLGFSPRWLNYRDDVEEMRSKMGRDSHLTVTMPDVNGKLLPLGVVHAFDLHQSTLGTVSLRDFCNKEETKIPSYLEVISVIDHHKSTLQTGVPPLMTIADTQSSNVLCAELAFAINDQFSLRGMTQKSVKEQIQTCLQDQSTLFQPLLLRNLFERLFVAEKNQTFFVDVQREFIEYLHFLFGILDDTDLLTKVTPRDLLCVVSLLNRLKSITVKKEVEIVSLDDLPRDASFMQKAADRLLKHPELYSLYKKIYLAKEGVVEENIRLCVKGQPSTFFADTKEQNGCVRAGQSKLFARNYPLFDQAAPALRSMWIQNAEMFWKDHQEIDLHLQMISTVAGADDVYKGQGGDNKHLDELWIWQPSTEQSLEHLKEFLNAFRHSPQLKENTLVVEFYGERAQEYAQAFKESFLSIAHMNVIKHDILSMAILKYRAGSLNSRKAMISPYLPKLV